MKIARRESESEFESINVVPMIDVFLILLVILMVTTRLDQIVGYDVDLPSAASAQPLDEQDTIEIAITKDSEVFLGTNEVNMDTEAERIRDAVMSLVDRGRNFTVQIRGDTQAQHGLVVQVMDLVTQGDPMGKYMNMTVMTNKEGQ